MRAIPGHVENHRTFKTSFTAGRIVFTSLVIFNMPGNSPQSLQKEHTRSTPISLVERLGLRISCPLGLRISCPLARSIWQAKHENAPTPSTVSADFGNVHFGSRSGALLLEALPAIAGHVQKNRTLWKRHSLQGESSLQVWQFSTCPAIARKASRKSIPEVEVLFVPPAKKVPPKYFLSSFKIEIYF